MSQLAQILVRSVVRAFYEVEHVVVVDALAIHSALSLDDLAVVLELSKHNKTVSKLCGKLKEGGLVSVYSRQEIREFINKAVAKEYYYIDYRRAIDAIKYRIHMVDDKIKSLGKASAEKKDLFCSRCESEYTHMDVLDSVDPHGRGSGFLCKKCGNLLTLRKAVEVEEESSGMPALFNRQFGAIIALLHQIDNVTVPAANPEQLLAEARPVQLDSRAHPSGQAASNYANLPAVRPSAVKGITSGPEKIEVSFSTSTETYAAEKAADIERRARLAEQNQLPEWHTKSTVTGEGTTAGVVSPELNAKTATVKKEEGEDVAMASQNTTSAADDEDAKKGRDPALDAYFAALRAEQETQANKSDDEDDEEEDEDEDEFEDVAKPVKEEDGTDGNTATATGTGKASGDGDTTNSNTNTSTNEMPASGPGADAETANAGPSNAVKEEGGAASDADSEENDFEDAL